MFSSSTGRRFLEHYRRAGFQLMPRGSLIDPQLPMTFVGSAGLTQIETSIQHGVDHSGEQYVLLQPCFRHFDVEQVGHSPVHLSLFEMGGAFSFGQVDRMETVAQIWDFLTRELEIDVSRLWTTYFSGGVFGKQALSEDKQTRQAWIRMGLPASRVRGVDLNTGYWRQGSGLLRKSDSRKCGPTSEVYFDRGTNLQCGPYCSPICGCGRFIEIANVLMIHSQIEQKTESVIPLEIPFDETVIGVERLDIALQHKQSVFELDSFQPLIKLLSSFCTSHGMNSGNTLTASLGIVVDHIRALLFLVADDAPPPGKGGRARIVRALIRQVLAHQQILCPNETEFVRFAVDEVITSWREIYPQLNAARDPLLRHFSVERNNFVRTLSRGNRGLERMLCTNQCRTLTGSQMLFLVKNQGYPLALLEATLIQRGIQFDLESYQNAHAIWHQAYEEASIVAGE